MILQTHKKTKVCDQIKSSLYEKQWKNTVNIGGVVLYPLTGFLVPVTVLTTLNALRQVTL